MRLSTTDPITNQRLYLLDALTDRLADLQREMARVEILIAHLKAQPLPPEVDTALWWELTRARR